MYVRFTFWPLPNVNWSAAIPNLQKSNQWKIIYKYFIFLLHHVYMNLFCFLYLHCNIQWCIFSCQIWVKNSIVICLHLVKVRIWTVRTFVRVWRTHTSNLYTTVCYSANIKKNHSYKHNEEEKWTSKLEEKNTSVKLFTKQKSAMYTDVTFWTCSL
jgi:hypothetical protein